MDETMNDEYIDTFKEPFLTQEILFHLNSFSITFDAIPHIYNFKFFPKFINNEVIFLGLTEYFINIKRCNVRFMVDCAEP